MSKEDTSQNPVFIDKGLVVAFSRSIQISEGLFYCFKGSIKDLPKGQSLKPIRVLKKGIRGQTSQFIKSDDDRDKKNAGDSNVQIIESAVIPPSYDGAALNFSIRFLPHAMRPHACNFHEVVESYKNLAKTFRDSGGFRFLSERYLWNVFNARFVWRNRFQSDEMLVKVEFEDHSIIIDPLEVSLENHGIDQIKNSLVKGDKVDVDELVDKISKSLGAESDSPTTIKVFWYAKMLPGQEIFPSQEYQREEEKLDKIVKVYAKFPTMDGKEPVEQASIHSQKIGAAIRHIDTWHGDETHKAIAVNPYGGVQDTGDVLRKKKNSFYDYLKGGKQLMSGLEKASNPNEISNEVYFVMANLIRGGVFSGEGK